MADLHGFFDELFRHFKTAADKVVIVVLGESLEVDVHGIDKRTDLL